MIYQVSLKALHGASDACINAMIDAPTELAATAKALDLASRGVYRDLGIAYDSKPHVVSITAYN